MKNRLLMIFLFVCFIGLLAAGYFYYRSKTSPVRDSLPLSPQTTPFLEISSTPIPLDPFVEKGKALSDDLTKINIDLQKIKTEDARFFPPEFLFDKNLPQ